MLSALVAQITGKRSCHRVDHLHLIELLCLTALID